MSAPTIEANGYKPISDYAAIGDMRTVALVGRDGSIDWCCFPRLDKESVFGALLDARKGGRFRVSPLNIQSGDQKYIENSNVLVTRFNARGGGLSVTDFMPVSGNIHGHRMSLAPAEIHRILECGGGDLDVTVEWSPRFDYGRAATRISRIDGGWIARADGKASLCLSLPEGEMRDEGFGPFVYAEFRMEKNSRRALVTRWESEQSGCNLDTSIGLLEQTVTTWKKWSEERTAEIHGWAGDWTSLLIRSELVLKLLSHADTGTIAAAPTTSLPELIGGVRNWDYRYTWIRDASLAAQSLASLGHMTEAREYLEFLHGISKASAHQKSKLQVMYGLHGETELTELELRHWEGYRGSAPVRAGNKAVTQFQMGIRGELLNTAFELESRGRELEKHDREFLAGVADDAAAHWDSPDHGIWEIRGEPRHFTYSKVMAWVCLDRAVNLAKQFGYPGNVAAWDRHRNELRNRILKHGYSKEVNSFVLSFGSRDLDAANLRIPLLGFLPFEDLQVQATVNRTMEDLMENGCVRRYRFDDGLPGKEGAFNLCTFWLVDVLALSGRTEEAAAIFERMASRANHCGLFSEEIDPATGEFLGNFPQAFTHVGLINSAIYLAYGQGKKVPEHTLIGTAADKRKLRKAEC
jgi:GH15 family glucan-1,4-alpha-glucosidase